MSSTAALEQTRTAASVVTALVHINTALARRRCFPGSMADNLTVQEVRELKLYLQQNPSACTPDGLVCRYKLLEVSGS